VIVGPIDSPWCAYLPGNSAFSPDAYGSAQLEQFNADATGETKLIAGMRARVKKAFGDLVSEDWQGDDT
jgi:hypothetical protein